MAVFRINKTSNYTVMSNHHLKDRGLSLKAKGLLSLMLSLPDDWDYSINGLCAICVESESAVNSALKELKKRGYLKVNKIMPGKSASGRIEYEYNIFEQPYEKQAEEKQDLENLPVEKQGLENQGQLNTDEAITNQSKTKKSKTDDKKESKKAKRETFNDLIDSYTKNDTLYRVLGDYIQMRTAIRKPLTNRALELVFKKLDELARTDAEKIAILNQSIMNSWQGLFPLKSNQGQHKSGADDRFYPPVKSNTDNDDDFMSMLGF